MSFGSPAYLSLLLLALVAGGLILWWAAWRGGARRRFGATGRQPWTVYAAPVMLLAALIATAFAAARPQAGSRDVRVDQQGVDLVIVLDVSNSMLADDAQPTRLGRAQAEIDALLERMQGNRVGLVIFARLAFGRSPLTNDLQALRGIVDGVGGERALVPPGSDLGAAIRGAQQLLQRDVAQTKAMLIVSDGEDRATTVAGAISAARGIGIRVYTAGVGTPEGSPIRDIDPASGVSTVRVDADGHPVLTRLDASALRAIASAGGGRYIGLSGDGRPLTSLAAELKDLAQTGFGSKRSSEPIERFQLVAALAILLLAGPLIWPLLRGARALSRSTRRLWPLAAAGLMIGAICSTVATVNRHGNSEYARGNFDAALADYRTAQAIAPARGELHYNAGNAYDRSGAYDKSIEETLRALPATGDLLARIEYALGNHYAGAAKPGDALEAYKRALLADPADADAKHNLEVVTARLTPSPSPTPLATPRPQATEPSASTPDAGQGGTPAATAGAGSGEPTPGSGDGQLTQEQLDQALAEALAGNDKRFTEDEAIHVLELLDEANRRVVEQRTQGLAGSTPPDY